MLGHWSECWSNIGQTITGQTPKITGQTPIAGQTITGQTPSVPLRKPPRHAGSKMVKRRQWSIGSGQIKVVKWTWSNGNDQRETAGGCRGGRQDLDGGGDLAARVVKGGLEGRDRLQEHTEDAISSY